MYVCMYVCVCVCVWARARSSSQQIEGILCNCRAPVALYILINYWDTLSDPIGRHAGQHNVRIWYGAVHTSIWYAHVHVHTPIRQQDTTYAAYFTFCSTPHHASLAAVFIYLYHCTLGLPLSAVSNVLPKKTIQD